MAKDAELAQARRRLDLTRIKNALRAAADALQEFKPLQVLGSL